MKQHMMIVGAEIIRSGTPEKHDGVIKVTVVPLTLVKKKAPGLMDMLHGNMEDVIQQVQGTVQTKDCIHITSNEWLEHNYCLGKHITLEIYPDETTGGV